MSDGTDAHGADPAPYFDARIAGQRLEIDAQASRIVRHGRL
jgi:hypothetical protein